MMYWRKAIAVIVALLAASGLPAIAEADGEHIHLGAVHFDPIVGGGIAIFVGLITLMFVGQWIRFNAARRRAVGTTPSLEQAEKREETANGHEQEDGGKQP